ncbi:MAG TPA: CBS domain-containing protein [Sulfuricella sp.]|nr:CBS domain-containing protein [Sulfuricella sp.]
MADFFALPLNKLTPGATYYQPQQVSSIHVELEDAAVRVMTDLKMVMAITIAPDKPVDAASERMIRHSVRLLLVIDDQESVLGLITATDILGEKPLQFIQKSGGRREDVLVSNIMTPLERLEVLCMKDVAAAKVGHIVATLKKCGRQHALVVDTDASGQVQRVRGIFSASQISRLLGTEIQTAEIARTFAEIQAQLAG